MLGLVSRSEKRLFFGGLFPCPGVDGEDGAWIPTAESSVLYPSPLPSRAKWQVKSISKVLSAEKHRWLKVHLLCLGQFTNLFPPTAKELLFQLASFLPPSPHMEPSWWNSKWDNGHSHFWGWHLIHINLQSSVGGSNLPLESTGVKVTGDPVVPRGQVTSLSPSHLTLTPFSKPPWQVLFRTEERLNIPVHHQRHTEVSISVCITY